MTAAVDAGRIVRQASFEIAPDETAFSLNARCYEAGLATFVAIVQDLARDDLALTPQQGSRSYFGRDRRPESLATLDWSHPAAQLAALVRALDFGAYPNPLALAKVSLGRGMLTVRTARVMEGATRAAPGTVIAVDGDQMRVATGQGDLMLGGCIAADGLALAQAVAPGTVLPELDGAQAQTLAARTPQIARGEAHWMRAMAAAQAVTLPYPSGHGDAAAPAQRPPRRVPLSIPADGATTVAAFFAWLSALTGQECVSALYADAVLVELASGLDSWVTPWVPLTLATGVQTPALNAAAAAEVQIAKARQAGPCTRDLPLRLGDKHPGLAGLAKIGVALADAVRPAGLELLLTVDATSRNLELHLDGDRFSGATAELTGRHLAWWLEAFRDESGRVAQIPLAPPQELQSLALLNATAMQPLGFSSIHEAVAAQVARAAGHGAVAQHGQSISYGELEQRATALAGRLRAAGVNPGDIVGLCLERTPDLVVAMLAILKAGAAYLPLDPDYPRDRIAFMIADSGTRRVVATSALAGAFGLASDTAFLIDGPQPEASPVDALLPAVAPDQPAYVIYTSGSTGRPKGVVVTHANALNFFAGMSQRVPHEPPGRWLAVTSLSFDISVLELCWTLDARFHGGPLRQHRAARAGSAGFQPLLFRQRQRQRAGRPLQAVAGRREVRGPRRLLRDLHAGAPLPCVRRPVSQSGADQRRHRGHHHPAADPRAGSCVLPLHHPIRVAEEWSFVDNISQGRVGVSFAAGWQPNDFAIAPAAFADRKNAMLDNIEVVRRLWRGESVEFPGPLGKPVAVQTLPRPIQKELPIWLTAAGNPETFQQAGALGCHLLTHLLGERPAAPPAGPTGPHRRRRHRRAGHHGGHRTRPGRRPARGRPTRTAPRRPGSSSSSAPR